MICCKCGRTIDRTYGRITDLGNYCKACAFQNENEVNQIVQSAIEKAKAQAVKEFAEKIKTIFYYEFDEIIPSIMSYKIDELLKEYEE